MSPSSILSIFIAALFSFLLLGGVFDSIQSATLDLSYQLGEQHNESLGTCSATGDCTFYVSFPPVKSGSWTVYANGTPHTAWVNATVAVTLSTGLVNITATGDNPSTASAAITIDYARAPKIENISAFSSLPQVAAFLFFLMVIAGIMLMLVRR